jgi:hypothetical protein
VASGKDNVSSKGKTSHDIHHHDQRMLPGGSTPTKRNAVEKKCKKNVKVDG